MLETTNKVGTFNTCVVKVVDFNDDEDEKGEEINGLGVEFTSSCVGVVGDERDIRFWVDRWVDNRRLCDRFPRLYHLERRKESNVMERGGGDRWKWAIGEDGKFTVKELSKLIEEKILVLDNGGHESLWNKLVPKKVNIFAWRALRGRLPVRVELDRRGVDLDSILSLSLVLSLSSCYSFS
ncbi:RNA-directed DNA polymerase, eukaryota, reverse transcriptase zinc-binding domain protein [Tanacetum coccineum]